MLQGYRKVIITCREGKSDRLVDRAMEAGAPGATISRLSRLSLQKQDEQSAAREQLPVRVLTGGEFREETRVVHEKDIVAFINDSRKFLGLELDEARRALGSNVQSVCADAYGSLENLISLENPQSFPGTLYLEQQRVVLVRLSEDGLRGYSKDAISPFLGDTPVRLRSPGGKQANLMVNAHEGIACSCLGDLLQFIELFEPCSQRSYEKRIYKKPLPFIR